MGHLTSLVIVPAFGIDTFVVAVGLGAGQFTDQFRLAATVAVFEGGMPLLGALVGSWLAHRLSSIVVYAAAALLAALALREFWEGVRELREEPDVDEGDEPSGEGRALRRATSLLTLVSAGMAVSLDELTAGIAAGAARLDLTLLVPALAVQAVLFTLLGLAAGARLRRAVGRYGEMAGGLALFLAAIVVVILAGPGV
ncbi:MAG: manganese efflux pump MntP family protein [Clostridia bacterium]